MGRPAPRSHHVLKFLELARFFESKLEMINLKTGLKSSGTVTYAKRSISDNSDQTCQAIVLLRIFAFS